MEAGEFLKLFDYGWFEREVFMSKDNYAAKSVHDEEIHESQESKINYEAPNLHHFRSLSDRCIRFNPKHDESSSKPKLEKILSGKEVEFSKVTEEEKLHEKKNCSKKKKKSRSSKGIMRKSRSFSTLEIDEVKGFIDLGFIFTEEDKSSSLVSIIPGLQKWGKMANQSDEIMKKIEVSRPYLSEAWGDHFNSKKKMSIMNLKIPSDIARNEVNMKDQIRAWAQNVASTVR